MKSFLSPPWTVPAAAQGCLETQKSDATFFVLCFLEVVSVRLPACSLNGEGRWVELGIPGEDTQAQTGRQCPPAQRCGGRTPANVCGHF
jgi:hypothetical protein